MSAPDETSTPPSELDGDTKPAPSVADQLAAEERARHAEPHHLADEVDEDELSKESFPASDSPGSY